MKRFRKILVFLIAILACLILLRALHFRPLTKPFPSAIVVHESASCWGDARAIRGWHENRGWSDIGYHAVILNGHRTQSSKYDLRLDGKIEPGRPETKIGSHCEADNMNAVALGVCLVGFPGQKGYPTKRQIDSLIHYCAAKCRQYDISPTDITQHSDHEYRKPLCASLNMKNVRARVEAELQRHPGS